MKKYENLELVVLSCLLQKPELMKNTILENKHFLNHKRIWIFLKSFYERFGNFDFNLMFAIVKNKEDFLNSLANLYDFELLPNHFKEYESLLIKAYEQKDEDREKIEKIYVLANELYVGKIDLQEFVEKIKDIT